MDCALELALGVASLLGAPVREGGEDWLGQGDGEAGAESAGVGVVAGVAVGARGVGVPGGPEVGVREGRREGVEAEVGEVVSTDEAEPGA